MDAFRIEGGVRLAGTVRAAGNKNAALPILAACLLTEEPVTLSNLPDIGDVRTMLEILVGLGVSVERLGPGRVRLVARGTLEHSPDPTLTSRIRASFLLAAPLAVRSGSCRIRRPGGDVIGRRRLDTHIVALRALGMHVDIEATEYVLEAPARLGAASIFLDEASVTATEHAITGAVLAKGTTLVRNAASEPHVQELCRFLVGLGAHIDGIGTNVLSIEGVERLGGGEHTIGPDHIEVGSWIGLAAVTGSTLRIQDAAPPEDHEMIALGFARLGVRWKIEGKDLIVPGEQELCVADDIGGAISKIDDAPWPGFPADLMSIAVVLATQAHGTILIHEKMFESRLFFVDKLVAMGARIVLCDPHRAVVIGPSRLRGAELSSPDIRAGMALLIAALCAEGTSTIHNVRQIDRGYEHIDERLRGLGARITRVAD